MRNVEFVPYREEYNDAALGLEKVCPQGESLVLRFVRKRFSDRSAVYDDYRLLCAMESGRLIGIAGMARKKVRLHGKEITALHGYDLRVHPEFRKGGTALRLSRRILDEAGEADCSYTFISGENGRALANARLLVRRGVVIPLTYVVMPVYRPRTYAGRFVNVDGGVLHDRFLAASPGIEFTPRYDHDRMKGYVASVTSGDAAGCSVWTNSDLLAEEVVRLPRGAAVAKRALDPLRGILRVPSIPAPGDLIKSHFLYDVYARSGDDLRSLLSRVNNDALEAGRNFLYMLLPDNSPVLGMVGQLRLFHLRVPYRFIANGACRPRENDRLYIDIRDL